MNKTSKDIDVSQQTTPQDKKPFIDPVYPPDPTHEAYVYDKEKNTKRIVAQGTEKEIKTFVSLNRKPGKWLYMRKIETPNTSVDQLNQEMLGRK